MLIHFIEFKLRLIMCLFSLFDCLCLGVVVLTLDKIR